MNYGYNFLNLISEVGQNSATKATYTWSADGTKLSVREPGIYLGNGGGFQYVGSLIYKYVSGQLQLESGSFSHGRIVAAQGSSTTYTPNFFLTDHLGSTRVVWDGANAERSDYYPFGGRWTSAGIQATTNRFQYNGKELQTTGEVNYLDYGARMYDSRIGRWHSIDRFAEKYQSHSPYAYAVNDPIKHIDINGDSVWVRNIFNESGELVEKELNIEGKVLNRSGTSRNMNRVIKRITKQIISTYEGDLGNGTSLSVNVNLSVANTIDDVKASDHLIVLVSDPTVDGVPINGGANMIGGKVAFVDDDYFSGPWDNTLGNYGPRATAHEMGHLLGLQHPSPESSFNIMNQGAGTRWGSWSTSSNKVQRRSIVRSAELGHLNRGPSFVTNPYSGAKSINWGQFKPYFLNR